MYRPWDYSLATDNLSYMVIWAGDEAESIQNDLSPGVDTLLCPDGHQDFPPPGRLLSERKGQKTLLPALIDTLKCHRFNFFYLTLQHFPHCLLSATASV